MRVTKDGVVGIGINPNLDFTTSTYKLVVGGKIGANEVLVSVGNPWPDYVYNDEYKTESLKVIHDYVFKYKHLRNMPSASDIKKNGGVNLGEVQTQTVKEIEQLYLQMFKMSDRITELEKQNAELNKILKR